MSKTKSLKIGIVGSGGTGKSTLGRELTKKINIPFLEAKYITAEILQRDKYDYSTGIQVERFLTQGRREEELLEKTINVEKDYGNYITDRTVVDITAYTIAEMHHSDPVMVEEIYNRCQKHAKKYTHLFVCPWGVKPLKNNQLRTLNSWYQVIIHSLDVGLLERWGLNYYVLSAKKPHTRASEIMKILKKDGYKL